jgi:hypothetical protein
MDTNHLIKADLQALFDIEIDHANEASSEQVTWREIKCPKCNGTAKFFGTYGAKAGKPIGDCFACKGTGLRRDEITKAIDVSKIQDAFAAAFKNRIKRPKLRLATFTFSRAPDTGRNAGSIYVKEGGEYLGKVTKGNFFPIATCGDERSNQVVAVASDPSNAAKAYGQRTGSCSCCGRELTNGVSIDLGIGPICAEKFGW